MDTTKYEHTFGGHGTPMQDAVSATVSGYRIDRSPR
jgi:hypothetical protein